MAKKILRLSSYFTRPYMVYYSQNFQGEKKANIRISSSSVLNLKKKLILEKNVYIGHYIRIEASNGIHLDEGVQLASYSSIVSHSSHISLRLYGDEYGATKDPIGYIKGAVYIGKYTFIGPHAFIMPNTKIGKGCIVKAYSYVRGDFPDFSIIAGNPAKVVGDTRTSDLEILNKNPELVPFYENWAKE